MKHMRLVMAVMLLAVMAVVPAFAEEKKAEAAPAAAEAPKAEAPAAAPAGK